MGVKQQWTTHLGIVYTTYKNGDDWGMLNMALFDQHELIQMKIHNYQLFLKWTPRGFQGIDPWHQPGSRRPSLEQFFFRLRMHRWFGVPSVEVPPTWMVYTREYAIKMDDWSVPPSGNLHLNEMVFHLNTKRNDKSQGLHLNWDEVLPSLDSFVHTLFYWCLVGNGGTIQSRTITIWLFNIAMENHHF